MQRKKTLFERALVTLIAASVVFCALHVGDIAVSALETETHVHSAECYTKQRGAQICAFQETEPHIHTAVCYNVISEETENFAHTHSDACYTRLRGELTCTMREYEGHAHGDECFIPGETLVCGMEEDETHSHYDFCYDRILICQIPESYGYAHTAACYEWRTVLICGLEESFGAAEPENDLVGEESEEFGQTDHDFHYEPVRELICGKQVGDVHIHEDTCYSWIDVLSCGKEDFIEEPTDEFIGEPMEELEADGAADVEWRKDWEETFSHVELTGAWSQDLLAIAESQMGYEESERNFILDKEGNKKGYTRYGHWYGNHYGDWCAMFASFCLNYAKIENMPIHCNCAMWIEELQGSGMYRNVGDHTPRPGDLIFFDYGRKNATDPLRPDRANHVGIVSEVIPATWDSPAQIVTIEGNNNNRVCNGIYELDNPSIIGYGLLPDGPAAVYSCGKTAHTHGSECNDETGASICPIPVHSHNEQCRTKQLQFTDGSVSVDISLTNAVYVPENVELRAALIQKEMSSYASMEAILEKALYEQAYSLQDAIFCRFELTVDGKPYELPGGVQAQVRIAYPSPVLASEEPETETQLYTHMLETKKTTGQIFDVNYEGRDGGITALYFSAYRLSEATVALATVADCK